MLYETVIKKIRKINKCTNNIHEKNKMQYITILKIYVYIIHVIFLLAH